MKMTAEERKKFNHLTEEFAVIKRLVENHCKQIEEHTLTVNELNTILRNGMIKQIEDIWEELKRMRGDNGKERRKGTWARMPIYQKFATISAILIFFFRPEIQTVVKVVLEQFLGIQLQ